jgi:hypothetical protein
MLEKIGNPLGVFLVGFLAFDRSYVLGMRENDIDVTLENVENGAVPEMSR